MLVCKIIIDFVEFVNFGKQEKKKYYEEAKQQAITYIRIDWLHNSFILTLCVIRIEIN